MSSFPAPIPTALAIPATIAEALFSAAGTMIHEGIQKARKPKRRSVGATLRPGKSTPLWNTLVTQLKPYMEEHGAQANLARILGVQRQTINTWVTSKTRMPDAERTLLLISWLIAKQQGINPS
jgi:hypothetical protein